MLIEKETFQYLKQNVQVNDIWVEMFVWTVTLKSTLSYTKKKSHLNYLTLSPEDETLSSFCFCVSMPLSHSLAESTGYGNGVPESPQPPCSRQWQGDSGHPCLPFGTSFTAQKWLLSVWHLEGSQAMNQAHLIWTAARKIIFFSLPLWVVLGQTWWQ